METVYYTMSLEKEINKLSKGVRQLLLHSINEDKKQTELLLKILERSNDGYWDWHIGSGKDGEEDYEYMSPKFKAQLGYEDHELPNVPSSWQKACHPEDLQMMYIKVREHFESKGEKEFITQCRYIRKDGSKALILCKGEVIEWNEDGSPKRMVGTHIDITNLK